jgi:hypothetical protein
MLRSQSGEEFTTGVCTFRFRPPGDADQTPRIMVPIRLEGVHTEAVLDTGGIFLICNFELAGQIGIEHRNSLGSQVLIIRGIAVKGTLHRMNFELIADEGDDCILEVTAFVPNGEYEEMPVFLGMQNCLEHLRFAIDPAINDEDATLGKFHFGPRW